jgi:hypothetical protein
MTAKWFAACDGISSMGPYPSERAAYRALRLMPRTAREARPRVVPAPHGWFAVIDEPARAEVLPGTLMNGARVWRQKGRRQ